MTAATGAANANCLAIPALNAITAIVMVVYPAVAFNSTEKVLTAATMTGAKTDYRNLLWSVPTITINSTEATEKDPAIIVIIPAKAVPGLKHLDSVMPAE